MPLEIDNLAEFGAYCAHEVKSEKSRSEEEPSIWPRLRCAEKWGEFMIKASKQYGGGIESNIVTGLNYAQKPESSDYEGPIREGDTPRYSRDVVLGAAEVLGKFWKHREHFKKWYDTQVFIQDSITAEKPES